MFQVLGEPTPQTEITNDCERNADCWKTVGVCAFANAVSKGLEAEKRDRLVALRVQDLIHESCWFQLLKENIQVNISGTVMEQLINMENLFCPSHRVFSSSEEECT